MSTAARQIAVQHLEASSFTSQHAHEDILTFKQGIYEAAARAGILNVVALDEDLVPYNLQRQAVLIEPDQPADNAVAVQFKILVFHKQDEALRRTKEKILSAMDQATTRIVQEPGFGVLRRSITQILQLLLQEYSTITNIEIHQLKQSWEALRWDGSSDLITFLATFQENLQFLAQHHYAPSPGETLVTLQTAVQHVPAFAQMANNMFYQTHPLHQDQTLEHLMAIYRRVYRSQYIASTAATIYNGANQITEDIQPTTHLDLEIDYIVAAVREALPTKGTLSGQQITLIQKAITKAINDVLSSSPKANKVPEPKQKKSNTNGMRSNNGSAMEYLVNGKFPASRCPMHPKSNTHSWKECKLNEDNQGK